MTPQQEAAALRNFASAYDRCGVRARAQATVRVWKKGPESPSSLAVCYPKRLRADGGGIVNRPPVIPLLLSRHTKQREWLERSG